MDSENQQRHQTALYEADPSANSPQYSGAESSSQRMNISCVKVNPSNGNTPASAEYTDSAEILSQITSGRLLMVNKRRRNGLILCKRYYAEFAGPESAVGSVLDMDCEWVVPVGDLSLVAPESHEERQRAYLTRRQWIRLTQQFTDQSLPLQRAQMILNQFETYFDSGTIDQVPDEAFALLIGVLPQTVRLARRKPGQLNVKAKS